MVRGGGEMASAAARLLALAGFPVVILERREPLAVRRLVSFASAVFEGDCLVEGVPARVVDVATALRDVRAAARYVPVVIDDAAASLPRLRPAAVIDGRMRKAPFDAAAPIAFRVGLGPGFVAGEDVHAVVETQRGPALGRVVWAGPAEADTKVPAPVLGHTVDRVVRSPRAGRFRPTADIGSVVQAGDRVGTVEGEAVVARISGLVRGLVAAGVEVEHGEKLGDVDPRGTAVDPAAISEKARAVAAGALEAVLVGFFARAERS